jgi:hypothetical protein
MSRDQLRHPSGGNVITLEPSLRCSIVVALATTIEHIATVSTD